MPVIFFDPKAVEHKKLPPITKEMVYEAFGRTDLEVFTDTESLHTFLLNHREPATAYLLMSSGNFGGLVFEELADELLA